MHDVSDFTFLDDHNLVVATKNAQYQRLLEFIQLHSSGTLEYQSYFTMQLPKASEDAYVNGVQICSSSSPQQYTSAPSTPFTTSPRERLFIIEMLLSPPVFWRPKPWRMILRMETLYSLMSKTWDGGICRLEELDAADMRILEGPFASPLVESVSGSRYLGVEEGVIVVYDFSRYSRRGPQVFKDCSASNPRPIYDILYHPYWVPEVGNSLPYVKYRTALALKDHSVAIGESNTSYIRHIHTAGGDPGEKSYILTLCCT